MTYLNSADIYLGDVSSQSFEFIINPRPCIFLNPEKVKHKKDNSYRFWKSGKVIDCSEKLSHALKKASKNFQKKYKTKQGKLTAKNFYSEEGSTASQRAAKAITEYLDKNL
jgi:CDP-glycerol glycerophosphotransferase (TagB/SpsB family)